MAEAAPQLSTQQTTTEGGEESGKPPLSHHVPLPQNMECSKLDWLLQINEDYFKEQLKSVVSKAI